MCSTNLLKREEVCHISLRPDRLRESPTEYTPLRYCTCLYIYIYAHLSFANEYKRLFDLLTIFALKQSNPFIATSSTTSILAISFNLFIWRAEKQSGHLPIPIIESFHTFTVCYHNHLSRASEYSGFLYVAVWCMKTLKCDFEFDCNL
jgi:hypothetical protein